MALDLKYNDVSVRDDSERNPLNGTDEPVFVLRAQDVSSIKILHFYTRIISANSVTLGAATAKYMTKRMEAVIKVFEEWQKKYPERVKFPD